MSKSFASTGPWGGGGLSSSGASEASVRRSCVFPIPARSSDDEEEPSGCNLGFAVCYGKTKRIIDEMDVLEQEMIHEALAPPGILRTTPTLVKSILSSQLAVDAATSTADSRELGRARQRRPA